MNRFFFIFFIIIFFHGSVGNATVEDQLVIAGTGDSQEVVRQLARLFETTHPGTSISVPDSVGSSGGIKRLIAGTVGLARTARKLKPKEQGYGFTETVFALSPVVFATNTNQTKVTNITKDDILKLYDGTIKNWNEIGGEDHKMYVINREFGDSSRQIIDAYLTSTSNETINIPDGGKVLYSTQEAAEAIERHLNTIGYVTQPIAKKLQLNILSVDSIVPSSQNVQSKKYKLVTELYLVTPANPSKLATAFVTFVQETAAQEVISSLGIVPVKSFSK